MAMSFNDALLIRQAAFGPCDPMAQRYLIGKGYAVADPAFRVLLEAAEAAAARLPDPTSPDALRGAPPQPVPEGIAGQALRLLVAAGHVTQKKVDEALRIAELAAAAPTQEKA